MGNEEHPRGCDDYETEASDDQAAAPSQVERAADELRVCY